MHLFRLICYLVAFIMFILAAWPVPARWNLIAIGLAAWVLVPLADTVNGS